MKTRKPGSDRLPWSSGCRISACVLVAVLAAQGCAGDGSEVAMPPQADIEAVEIWAHPDTLGINVYSPQDFKAASRTVVWAIDGVANGVMRYEPSEGKHGIFGFLDHPPVEVVRPVRLAVSENTGVFVYDDSTGMVDVYSPGGQHLRGFDPGLRPSVLEVSQRPLRLTYGVRTFGADSIPTLSIIQTSFLGQDPDTLLSPRAGPESLRMAPAVGGRLVTAPSLSGLWVFAAAMSDTVFEVSGSGETRKLALPETDTLRVGAVADIQQEILWIAYQQPAGGFLYEAYDVSGSPEGGVIDGRQAYLGVRTTPPGFLVRAAFDGSVSGWWRGERGIYSPRGFDMRVDELREDAEAARAARDARRAAAAEEWTRILTELEKARQEALRATEDIRKEEQE